MTDGDGIVRWNRSPRPVFALARWGRSYAFLSLLPQPPFPSTIVGVRTESAVVHAGDTVRVAGFARTRSRGVLHASTGSASVSIRHGATTVAQSSVALDAAGAFSTSFVLPASAASGEYAVLAQAAGGVGGATVDVEANAAGLSLDVTSACSGPCDPLRDVPVLVHASRGGSTVRLTVVRSPHVYVGNLPEGTPWATAPWLDATVRTDDNGNATVEIPHPNDELGSTYGVHVEASGATADTRVSVPTAQAALRLTVDHAEQSIGTPLRLRRLRRIARRKTARGRGRHRRPYPWCVGRAAAAHPRRRRPRARKFQRARTRHELCARVDRSGWTRDRRRCRFESIRRRPQRRVTAALRACASRWVRLAIVRAIRLPSRRMRPGRKATR